MQRPAMSRPSPERTTESGIMACLHAGLHPCNPCNPWSRSEVFLHHGFHGFHGWTERRTNRAGHREANQSVEANRRGGAGLAAEWSGFNREVVQRVADAVQAAAVADRVAGRAKRR